MTDVTFRLSTVADGDAMVLRRVPDGFHLWLERESGTPVVASVALLSQLADAVEWVLTLPSSVKDHSVTVGSDDDLGMWSVCVWDPSEGLPELGSSWGMWLAFGEGGPTMMFLREEAEAFVMVVRRAVSVGPLDLIVWRD